MKKKLLKITENQLKNYIKTVINEEETSMSLTDKIKKIKENQERLNAALEEYKNKISDLQSEQEKLIPEVMEAFEGQTSGAEKLKTDVEGFILEVIQSHEKETVSYKLMSELILDELKRLDISLGKTAEQLMEDSKVASKVKGQLKIDSIKVYENEQDSINNKIIDWLDKSKEIKDKHIQNAELSIEAIEKAIEGYEEEESNKYATPNMDDIESGVLRENNGKQVSEKTKQTIEKWVSELGNRKTAVKLIDYFLAKMTGGLSSSDLGDTTIFADGLDEIEDNLSDPSNYYYALSIAKDTASAMMDDEGFGGMFDEGVDLSALKDSAVNEMGINPEADEISPEDLEAASDMYDNLSTNDEEFVAHGSYTVSNTGGYEIMLSDDGEAAKVRDAFGSDNPQTSDWLEIEYVDNEETGEPEPVIDPSGYNIPLNMVMRVNEESWMKMRAGAKGEVYENNDKLNEAINRFKKIINY